MLGMSQVYAAAAFPLAGGAADAGAGRVVWRAEGQGPSWTRQSRGPQVALASPLGLGFPECKGGSGRTMAEPLPAALVVSAPPSGLCPKGPAGTSSPPLKGGCSPEVMLKGGRRWGV